MKRLIPFLLALILPFALLSCSQPDPIQRPVTFYYRSAQTQYSSEDPVIIPEIRERIGHENDYRYMLEEYFKGPRESVSVSPYPDGLMLIDLSFENDRAYVKLSNEITALSGHDLTVACACITKTVISISGVRSVEISAQNGLIGDQTGLVFIEDDFSLLDQYLQPITG